MSHPSGPTNYLKAGVDTEREERVLSRLIHTASQTFAFVRDVGKPVLPIGFFANVIDIGHGMGLALSTDGVGTKIIVAQMMQKYDTVGIDCVAMNVNDAICVGAEPLAFVDYLALPKPDPALTRQIGIGLNRAAREANVTLAGGETAIVPELLKEFDLSGTCVGVVALSKIVDGRKARPGDVLIGVDSSGVHSNGFTLIRRLVERQGLSYRARAPGLRAKSLGLELLTPTRLYVRAVLELIESVGVTGLANITGGGLRNLLRIRRSLGFEIDAPRRPPRIFELLQEWGDISDREMHQTFNMGTGFCALVRPRDESEALRVLRRHFPSRVIGRATRGGGVRVPPLKGVRYEEY
jgi:phosphoribosylformylglycinamidine cyclo-ligase